MKIFPLHLIPNDTNFNFMRLRWVSLGVALLLAVVAVGAMAGKGFNYALDFTGGTVVEVRFDKPADVDGVRERLQAAGFESAQVQTYGTGSDLLIRLQPREGQKGAGDNDTTTQEVLAAASTPDNAARQLRSEFVGPQVGQELAADGLKALAFVVIGIMIYLSMRFEWKYAVAGIIANLHDVVIILGFFAFFQWEFSLSVLAAVLAVLGYSVNESVVIFDRIRENFRRFRKMSTVEVINNSITANISRTIITHGSTQIMVLSMLLFGGETLHYFAVALTIGILFGIYSSVFVAAAIAMWLGIRREDLVKGGGRKEGDPNDPNAGAVV